VKKKNTAAIGINIFELEPTTGVYDTTIIRRRLLEMYKHKVLPPITNEETLSSITERKMKR
jgi:hypothetical protein